MTVRKRRTFHRDKGGKLRYSQCAPDIAGVYCAWVFNSRASLYSCLSCSGVMFVFASILTVGRFLTGLRGSLTEGEEGGSTDVSELTFGAAWVSTLFGGCDASCFFLSSLSSSLLNISQPLRPMYVLAIVSFWFQRYFPTGLATFLATSFTTGIAAPHP